MEVLLQFSSGILYVIEFSARALSENGSTGLSSRPDNRNLA